MARTESTWEEVNGSYLKTQWIEGRDILINGTNKYLNFGSLSGTSGYGFRDNAGVIEVKNSGGAWAALGSGGSLTFSTGLTKTVDTVTANISTGLAGSQTIYGGTAANEDLTIEGTSHATKTTSYVILQPTGGNVGIGTSTPANMFVVGGVQAGNAGLEIVPGSGIVAQSYNRSSSAYASLTFDGSSSTFRSSATSGASQTFRKLTTTLAGASTGASFDYSTGVTNAANNFTGIEVTTAAVTAASTNTLRGITITPGAITNAGGTSTYIGALITMPAITQTSGTLTSTGLSIRGGTVTSGTSYAFTSDSTAGNFGIGTLTPAQTFAVDVGLEQVFGVDSSGVCTLPHALATGFAYLRAPTGRGFRFQGGSSTLVDFPSSTASTLVLGYAALQIGNTSGAGTSIYLNSIGASDLNLRAGDGNAARTADVIISVKDNLEVARFTDTLRLGVGTNAPDALLHNEVSDAGTNTVVFGQRHSHITSGTATTGFGIGEEYELENASGTNRVVGTVSYAYTDATNASEDASYTLQLMRAGTLATVLAIDSLGKVTARITPRTGTTTSSATPTINTDDVDFYSLTAQAADITSFTTNLSGTPTDGQKLWIAITGTGARAITWGASFEASTVALPTTTVTTARLDVGFVWNAVTSKWRCVASA